MDWIFSGATQCSKKEIYASMMTNPHILIDDPRFTLHEWRIWNRFHPFLGHGGMCTHFDRITVCLQE